MSSQHETHVTHGSKILFYKTMIDAIMADFQSENSIGILLLSAAPSDDPQANDGELGIADLKVMSSFPMETLIPLLEDLLTSMRETEEMMDNPAEGNA